MKVPFAFLLLAAACYAAAPASDPPVPPSPDTIIADLPVDQVWSGHPVTFALVTERGHQFIAYYDADRRPVVVYHRYDAAGKSQTYAARPAADASRWHLTRISDWDFRWALGGGGSLIAEVKLGPPILQPDRTLLVDFAATRAPGVGRWRLDGASLAPLATLLPPAAVLPASLSAPLSPTPGMEVQTAVSRDQGRRWILRWETLPHNRDEARSVSPPPSALRLYELPDADTSTAVRIGS